ncbi:YhdT family protein [Rummeliibacillus suwonensis]|jgi:Predicted membrane protein|uniref:YhdT family protein n=1 Tax=Rummeliibacillus suwonensis TaxID=1306154 RepID=UPI001AAE3B02|nr:YhdT family protein [Rummeliibacillus suwonensis]MBO2536164.1 YhdT family protein [Rummeliibacillus suwonensis]
MNDKRYKIAHREALIGIALVIINFAIWFGFAYGLGSGDPKKYSYVFGFPAWFFYSCIAGTIFMIILIIIVIKFFFKDVSFDTEEDGDER